MATVTEKTEEMEGVEDVTTNSTVVDQIVTPSSASSDESKEEGPKDEEEEEEELTMQDLVEQEEALEEEANAVVGEADPDNCSYSQGYFRQAIFVCLTCTPPSTEPAALCLACSLQCHDGHDVQELYTKRHFQCDCGNKKFANAPTKTCNLDASKRDYNTENVYNQNFQAKYCTCSRPYPDPRRKTPQEMAQCIVCEDWYHYEHLSITKDKRKKAEVPSEEEEVVCGGCMMKHPFLRLYQMYQMKMIDIGDEGSQSCKLDALAAAAASTTYTPIPAAKCAFFGEQWRTQLLCTCSKCQTMYLVSNVAFLTDPNDSLKFYAVQSAMNAESNVEETERAAGEQLSHTQQIDMAIGYHALSAGIRNYLKRFADGNKVVRKEDISNFFDKFPNKKARSD